MEVEQSGACLLEHDSSCQVSMDNGGTENIHVLIVQYGLRVEIKESKKTYTA